jgi:peptidoglycan hydrolase-like protein with peptidoglycan-binding domain
MKKYYEILGLDMAASIEEVEQAYKELSETWDPQTYQNLPRYRRKAEIKSKEINEAYERLSAFLLARPPRKKQDDDQTDHIPPDGALLESEPQTTPPEETIPSQISKAPQRKTLFYGLIAIALVFGVLVFYQISDRKKPAQQSFQTAVTGEEKPAPATASQPASTAPLQKEFAAQPAGESAVQKHGATTDTQNIAPPVKIDYDVLLTEERLDRYNQNPQRVKRAQKGLIANGYDTGPLDGIIGPFTTAALKQFAGDHALEADSLFASSLTDAVLLYAEVAATHPDWHSIMAGDDFAHWLNRQSYYQPGTLQNFKHSVTAQQVIDILNRYKIDKN